MDFGANKTPVEVIREGAFGAAYFRNTYSGVTESQGKNLISRKIFIRSFIAQIIMMSVLINMVLNVEHC